ncbi:MAG: hypothetical protein EA401_09055 [Planctomycetota bacterium]|nr:MAG: hypothetical protein EA401_09055 [Planctomycetota bacterium]
MVSLSRRGHDGALCGGAIRRCWYGIASGSLPRWWAAHPYVMAWAQPFWLIDGHNLLHTIGELRRLMSNDMVLAQECLLSRLAAVQGSTWCFFDGGPDGQAHSRHHDQSVVQVYAGASCADNAIIAWLQRYPQRRPATVITADRDLRLRARAQAAKVLDPIAFWRRHVPRNGASVDEPIVDQHRPLAEHEVEEWLRYFEADD